MDETLTLAGLHLFPSAHKEHLEAAVIQHFKASRLAAWQHDRSGAAC